MLKYSLLLLAVAGFLLCQTLEAKKIKEKPKQKPDEPAANQHQHVPPANHEPHPHQEFDNLDVNGNNNNEAERERIVKPKHLKLLSNYDKCKAECKRLKDQESAQEYVERLREELRIAEQQLSQRDDRVIEL